MIATLFEQTVQMKLFYVIVLLLNQRYNDVWILLLRSWFESMFDVVPKLCLIRFLCSFSEIDRPARSHPFHIALHTQRRAFGICEMCEMTVDAIDGR